MNWRAYLLPLLIVITTCNTLISVPSSTLTLVQSVPYLFNYTYTSRTIAASTTVVLSLSLNFNINTSSLTNCMFATTLSTSYTGTTCTVTTNTSGNYIFFPSIFTAQLTSETVLSIKVSLLLCSYKWPILGEQAQKISISHTWVQDQISLKVKPLLSPMLPRPLIAVSGQVILLSMEQLLQGLFPSYHPYNSYRLPISKSLSLCGT